jgi:hypothetical protein
MRIIFAHTLILIKRKQFGTNPLMKEQYENNICVRTDSHQKKIIWRGSFDEVTV